MHQTGECRWNQPLVTCTFPFPSQQSLRQISLKNTHTVTIDFQLTSIAKTTKSIRPDQTLNAMASELIRFSAVDYVYLCITREGERRRRIRSSIPTEAKRIPISGKYSSGLSVSEEISELATSKKEKISSYLIDKNQLFRTPVIGRFPTLVTSYGSFDYHYIHFRVRNCESAKSERERYLKCILASTVEK